MKQTCTYKTVDSLDIEADVYVPGGTNVPVIFWIHGGALIGGQRNGLSDEQRNLYLDAGYAVVSIDYRLAPETKIAGIIEDVQGAWRWMRGEAAERFSFDPDRTAVVGHSAGGYLTLMTGFCVEPRPKALLPFYGYGDIVGEWYSRPDRFYCTQPAVPKEEAYAAVGDHELANQSGTNNRGRFYLYCRQHGIWPQEVAGHDPETEPDAFEPFSPVRNVTPEDPPTTLLHGTADTDVPYDLSVMMAEELARVGVEHELVTIEGGPHGFDGRGLKDPVVRNAFDRVLGFLQRHV